MLQFRNQTPFTGTILLMPDIDGVDSLYTVVKATFLMGEELALAEDQEPVRLAAEYHGEPDASSVRVPSDFSLMKPGTDIVLLGTAYAPDGRSTTEMDVSLSVGDLTKTVRVFGDRVWRTGTGASISSPEPFDTMPLVWERAFGGSETVGDELFAEVRNPVGAGFFVAEGETPLDGLALPNLEDPDDLIHSWKDQPTPACFAPIEAHWEPRRSYAGTYDEAWQQQRAPYLPDDFDSRFFQIAPPGLIADGYLQGGELVDVRGATAHGWLQFRIPLVQLAITYVVDGALEDRPAVLDTVIIEPDADRFQLVWRAQLPCDKKTLKVSEVRAAVAAVKAG
jgi:hypothetical protein